MLPSVSHMAPTYEMTTSTAPGDWVLQAVVWEEQCAATD